MDTVKDLLFTTTMIGLIMLAIIGIFYSTMDHPVGPNVVVSTSPDR